MKFTITWKCLPGTYKAAVETFLRTGAPAPAGLKTLGRWHAAGSTLGWHLVEGDPVALAQHAAAWVHLLKLEVSPVIEDAEAASAASKVFGK